MEQAIIGGLFIIVSLAGLGTVKLYKLLSARLDLDERQMHMLEGEMLELIRRLERVEDGQRYH